MRYASGSVDAENGKPAVHSISLNDCRHPPALPPCPLLLSTLSWATTAVFVCLFPVPGVLAKKYSMIRTHKYTRQKVGKKRSDLREDMEPPSRGARCAEKTDGSRVTFILAEKKYVCSIVFGFARPVQKAWWCLGVAARSAPVFVAFYVVAAM